MMALQAAHRGKWILFFWIDKRSILIVNSLHCIREKSMGRQMGRVRLNLSSSVLNLLSNASSYHSISTLYWEPSKQPSSQSTCTRILTFNNPAGYRVCNCLQPMQHAVLLAYKIFRRIHAIYMHMGLPICYHLAIMLGDGKLKIDGKLLFQHY
jgi:hypothetical protein